MSVESGRQFMRPVDLGRTRRNQRQLRAHRLLIVGANVILITLFAIGGVWIFQRTQQDSRFEIRSIETVGASRTTAAQLDAITSPYIGANLFKINLARLDADLRALPWVKSVAVEKRLPDGLILHLFERVPVALVLEDGRVRYADADGVVFDEMSPEIGAADFPLITGAGGPGIVRCIAFLQSLRAKSPELHARVSEVTPVEPDGFLLYDRALYAQVVLPDEHAVTRWKTLYGIAAAEGYGPASIEYADLRFRERVIVRPKRAKIAVEPHREIENSAIAN
ncbi:MAG TPA: FtsQ-type POTRA domain-containing protein [Thermoanaerobaculia bacterium]|nr:FtsQ-type POTRA domain-containing protein [Thermoanaerobaculia bacterium]